MAISQISSSKKTTSKTASSITAKKTLAKKVAATPARKVSVPKASKPLPAANKTAKAAATRKVTSNKGVAKSSIAPKERHNMIEVAAYWRAEHRGFASGHALDDWVAAEVEIDAMINA